MSGFGTNGENCSFGDPEQLRIFSKQNEPIEPSIWKDEKRMKEEIIAWAKAVAAISAVPFFQEFLQNYNTQS
ncbi:hypothetical protein MA16_Dca017305 [Dendrobium catenatum]|uniref:Uncharacterized protein n=1 Tax=Dendrobium catenatum TaxID=906689 RepID=A0A2I0XG38_9ASPA|nr:hypothetical protein MA16_Dca017305 [Dendrobium catenatum]